MKGFDYDSISFKKAANVFESMETVESIDKDIVEPSYKKPTREDANRAGRIMNKRGEAASSKTSPAAGEITDKCRKIYVYCLTR